MHSVPPSLLWSHPACPDLPTPHGLNPLFCSACSSPPPGKHGVRLVPQSYQDPEATQSRPRRKALNGRRGCESLERAGASGLSRHGKTGWWTRTKDRPARQRGLSTQAALKELLSCRFITESGVCCLRPGETRRATCLLNCGTLRDPHSAHGVPLRDSRLGTIRAHR